MFYHLKPISSLKLPYFLGLLLILFGCNKAPEPMTIIKKSIVAHGGQALWESFKKIEYLKEIKLYDSLGTLEQTIMQMHTHEWQPKKSVMEWNPNGTFQRVEKTAEGISVFENGEAVTATQDLDAMNKIMDAALYVFWQPYKLFDDQAMLTYEGTTQLLGNQKVHQIRIHYDDDPQADIWHYYFDVDTYRLKASQVNHDGRISLIMNESVEENTGLFLNQVRKSYFVNPDLSIRYLRAAYFYTIISYE